MNNTLESSYRYIFANEHVSLNLSNVISASQLIKDFFSNEGIILITVGFIKITEKNCVHMFESGDYVELPVRFEYNKVQIDKITDILWLQKVKIG